MLGLRITPPRPFWLEDLAYAGIDRARRLRARAAEAAHAVARQADAAADRLTALISAARLRLARPAADVPVEAPAQVMASESERLDAPLEWALATEPITAARTATASAVALHKAAGEQLDALSYALDRIRDEVRPLLTYARFADDTVHHLPVAQQLETSIEALLELSRQNAATRPKGRVLSAA